MNNFRQGFLQREFVWSIGWYLLQRYFPGDLVQRHCLRELAKEILLAIFFSDFYKGNLFGVMGLFQRYFLRDLVQRSCFRELAKEIL